MEWNCWVDFKMAKVKSLWEDKYNAVADHYHSALADGLSKDTALSHAENELKALGFYGERLKDELEILAED